MADTRTAALLTAAAEATVAVPGVAGLQPGLVHRLTEAVRPVLPQTLTEHAPSGAGVRAEHAPDGSGWHIKVRCAVAEGNCVLDAARRVHEQVRSAVLSHLAEHSAPEALAVTVTVTRVEACHHERAPHGL
ncbi:hypothetical protein SAMN05428944_0052 [Streptomyces sp. 1222.5]|uniref:hypothetical protein n=1 Tax=unclassified Streptomyces TaxID=2593676 RepID=UPI00089A14F8|nr:MULTISPECIES: hypothetical protein [unclassified Streptomyces]PKW04990.1 hypothetical protein BX260_0049 [Streptomyces sp. 5112.2]SEB52915.1 hypothetical protein SAMN05428944_0052 [Streptomyces sp. 1222.5]